MTKKINVLIVDDSLVIRKRVEGVLNKTDDISVVGEAVNGKEAIEKAQLMNPDVVLMDLMMPVMSGVAAIEYLMENYPLPIVVHSPADNKRELYKTWDALSAGALARIDKNVDEEDPIKWEKDLLRTLRAASRIKVIRKRKKMFIYDHNQRVNMIQAQSNNRYNIVVIGASTGGPGVIANILKGLPSNFPIPILLVIHIGSTSSLTFADWLGSNCSLKVSFASNGELITNEKGRVFIAPYDKHMIVEGQKIKLIDTPHVNFCRPSVDVMFNSVADNLSLKPMGLLLTGMGQDGAMGLKNIKDKGGYTICQDEVTSVVFGMAQAAITLGAVDVVLPDHLISEKIMSLINWELKGN
ncbi:MAG: chemotaxis-specific protein-glutamate methyltransferase CheB [Desulfobacterales bacterium]|nr:chemotaxis-specific protein-glutamate methyltransferase CheB [Desulfobacterales bacterium]